MINETGFISVVRRWWWLLALGTVAAALAAYTFAKLERPTYASTATLLVGPLNADYTTTRVAGDLGRTYAEVAKSLPVLKAVVARTGAPLAATDLAGDVTATSNDVTRLVTLKVESSTPQRAASLANALGAEMIEVSREVTPEESDAIREFLGQREVERLPAAQQDALRTAAVRVFGAGLTGRLHMIDPAVASKDAVAPKIALLTGLGALAGLALSAVVALVKSVGDERQRSDGQSVAEVGGIPFLGALERASGDGLVADEGPPRAVETYRLLGTKIGLFGGPHPIKSLVVVGADDRQASGAVAANLASVVAAGDARVLLVDAACGAATKLLRAERGPGCAELVRKGAARADGMLDEFRIARGERLDVLQIDEEAKSSLLEGERARRLLTRFELKADIVIVGVPPINRSPVGLVWASVADGTLVVGGEGRSREAVEEAASSLELVGAHLLGTVVSRGSRIRLPRLRLARAKEKEAA